MFESLFSNRYNRKREIFYTQYEEARRRFPNLPYYPRPKEPRRSFLKAKHKKRRPVDYDYDEWIAGHFVSIVVRRTIETSTSRQLMEPVGRLGSDGCTWRCWPNDANETLSIQPRRSARLADRKNLKFKQMSQPRDKASADAVDGWQQQSQGEQLVNKLEEHGETSIDGRQLACSMCCKVFVQKCDLQLHSLDDCRKYLLAQLPQLGPSQI